MKFQAGLQSECLRRAGVPQSGCKMHQGAVRPHWPQVLSPSGLAEVQPDPSSPLPAWPRTRVSGVGRTGGLRLSGTRPSRASLQAPGDLNTNPHSLPAAPRGRLAPRGNHVTLSSPRARQSLCLLWGISGPLT